MALASAVQNATRPSQLITWVRADGEPENLTNATLTGKIFASHTGEVRDIVGVLSVTSGPSGVFTWEYAAEDVATAGHHRVQFTATFPDPPTEARTVEATWRVHPEM